jgi:hypothetical protein
VTSSGHELVSLCGLLSRRDPKGMNGEDDGGLGRRVEGKHTSFALLQVIIVDERCIMTPQNGSSQHPSILSQSIMSK